MLCHLCEPFLRDLLAGEFVNWRHVEVGWYTYKHGNYAAVRAAAEAGCEMCALFNGTRRKRISGFEAMNDKWLVQQSSIDYKYEHDGAHASTQGGEQQVEYRGRWAFILYTVLPQMSTLSFEVFHPSVSLGLEAAEGSQDLPLAVPSTADSTTAIKVASAGLGQCVHTHSHCSHHTRAALPTRLLDIRPAGDTFDLRLQVNKGQQGQYVTLSHCWGNGSPLKLQKSNISDFRQMVPFDKLPQTFQDAVCLTAAMGQQYLWIDALCILQDDKDDWRREAASMCAVFENALFSISALNATDSHSGLFRRREHAQIIVDHAGRKVGIRERLPSLHEALKRSKLETRGWCLQERFLAPRILHVAPEQLHWECRTYIISETSPDEPLKNDSGEASRPSTAIMNPDASRFKVHDHQSHWLDLVSGYSARQLTEPSDRLPAIAGLAEKAKRELGLGTYMHGLWRDNLIAGLLWRRKAMRSNKVDRRPEFAPLNSSWSWASSTVAVEYPLNISALTYVPAAGDLELISRPSVKNDTIESLTLVAGSKRGSCKLSANQPIATEAVFKPSGSLLVDDGLTCFLDYPDEAVSKGSYCIFVGAFEQVPPNKRSKRGEQRSCYLILERTQDADATPSRSTDSFGTFRRIGMGFDLSQKVDKVFVNAERRQLELI